MGANHLHELGYHVFNGVYTLLTMLKLASKAFTSRRYTNHRLAESNGKMGSLMIGVTILFFIEWF